MPTIDEIIIREYRAGDEEQINLLRNLEYGTDRNFEQWQRKFRDGPYGTSIFAVAEYKGTIIGTQALMPVHLSWCGKDILSAKSDETLVQREYRGKGICKKLYDKCFEIAAQREIVLVWGFTKPAVRPLLKAGFGLAGKLKNAVLILNSTQVYKIKRNDIPDEVGSRLKLRIITLILLRSLRLLAFSGLRLELITW